MHGSNFQLNFMKRKEKSIKIKVFEILVAEFTILFFHLTCFYLSYALEYPQLRVLDTEIVVLRLLTEIIIL